MNCKKMISLLLVVALVLTALCGCGYNPETVVNVDSFDVPAGIYLSLQMQALGEAAEELGSAYYDITVLDEAMADGRTVRDYINERVIELCRGYVFIEREYERLGLEAGEYDNWYVDYMVSNYWQSIATSYMNNGISYESFNTYYRNEYYKKDAVLVALYGEGGEKALSAEDKLDCFLAHFTHIDYIEFPTSDASGLALTAEAKTLLSGIANDMLETARAQNSLQAAYLAHYGEVYTLTNSELTADAATYAETVSENSIISDLIGNFDEAFISMVLSLSAGEYGVYDSGSAIYLFKVNGMEADDTALAEYDAYIIEALASEPLDEYIKTSAAAYAVTEDARARKYYSPDNIKINNSIFA